MARRPPVGGQEGAGLAKKQEEAKKQQVMHRINCYCSCGSITGERDMMFRRQVSQKLLLAAKEGKTAKLGQYLSAGADKNYQDAV